MNYYKIIFTIIVIFHFVGYIPLYGQEDDLRNEIEKIIRYDTEMDFNETPGFIIGIVDNDEVHFYPFGGIARKSSEKLLKSDIFEIGSVTKVLTSSLISILEDEGQLSYQDKVNQYLPNEFKNPRLEYLTIQDLILHHSGLPKRPLFFGKKEKDIKNPYAHYSKSDLLEFYRDFIPDDKKFEYSHTNYALLEWVINEVTGKSLQDAMNEKLFSPLNMSNSFVDFPEQKENYLTPGYDRAQKICLPWTFSSFKSSEGAKSTIEDLVSFLKANLGLTNTGLEEVFNKNFETKTASGFNDQLMITMGWQNINMNQFNIITHTGKTSGHNAFIAMVRETKTGVVILSNSSTGTEDLGLQILRMINYNWKRAKT